jgi:hypothetical protein
MAESAVLLNWDQTGERFYETGVRHGVLYPYNSTSKAYDSAKEWNGLTSVSMSPEGAEANEVYADDIQYLNLYSAEKLKFTIEALQSPEEFEECDGSDEIAAGVSIRQQTRKMFGFSYETRLGNDVDGDDHGYKIHLIYGAKASPSEQSYETINDSPEPITLSWECSTTPVAVTGKKATAEVVIDSTKCTEEKLNAIREILYGKPAASGSEAVPGRLPLPDEIATIMAQG